MGSMRLDNFLCELLSRCARVLGAYHLAYSIVLYCAVLPIYW